VPEAGSTWLLPRIVGLTKAADWLISGRLIEATEAKEAKLVNNKYPVKDLLPAAYELAHNLISNTSAVSVACTKQMILHMAGSAELGDATAVESQFFFEMLEGPDVVEGIQAFLEKRPSKFPGKVSKDLPRSFLKNLRHE
jgi:enoyl-CoA hydratase/carnithine racemase